MSDELLDEMFESEADNLIVDEVEQVEQVETAEEETAPAAETSEQPDIDNSGNDSVAKQIEAFKSAALSERKKRQALEDQVRSMQEPVEKPDAYMAPDEAIEHANKQLSNDFTARLLNMSESQARLRHADFDEMNDVFSNLSADNPHLGQQALNAPDPYEFVYQEAKKHSEFSQIGSVSDYKAKIEAEIRAKIEAEANEKAKIEAENAINAALPQSLADSTAIGGNLPAETSAITLDSACINDF